MRTFSTFLIGSVLVILAVKLSAAEEDRREFETAKAEYEQSSRDESARITYVTKLAHIADRLVSQYRRSGERNELMRPINSELGKHPAPKDVDSKKLTQLLVGKWKSPRRTYVYRADHSAEPGLFHLLESRFRVLSLTGQRVTTRCHHNQRITLRKVNSEVACGRRTFRKKLRK